jgi:hypothetical protein
MNLLHIILLQTKKKKKHHTLQIICFVHYNKHNDPKNYYQKQLLIFHPFIDSKDSQLDGHPTWHYAYMTHEKSIIQTRSKFTYQFPNLNKNLNKCSCLEIEAHDLACVNNENIWIGKFLFVNDQTTLTPPTNNSNVEAYAITLDTHIQPQTILSTIPNTFEKNNDIILDK